jgi:predicted nucleotidyltransferase component of viral defense system
MDPVIEQMLTQHDTATVYDKKNAIKEVVQELVLCGLSRAGFFKTAAFYGGTALRLFCGLDRFSEDLDFSLKSADPLFDLAAYRPTLEKEIRAYGLDFKMETKAKTANPILSRHLSRGNTRALTHFLSDEKLADAFNINEHHKS